MREYIAGVDNAGWGGHCWSKSTRSVKTEAISQRQVEQPLNLTQQPHGAILKLIRKTHAFCNAALWKAARARVGNNSSKPMVPVAFRLFPRQQ